MLSATVVALFAFFIPQSASATATLVSGPTGATDITEETFGEESMPNNDIFAYDLASGEETEHEFVFSVEECPVLTLSLGGYMTEDSNWSCDEDELEVTMNVTYTDFVSGAFQSDEGDGDETEEYILVLALTYAAEVDGQGPGESETGMFMSTNVNQWQMTPPSPDDISFGFSLTGPEGAEGYFTMFMPQGTIDNLSDLSGEELTASDLAVFNDGEQASLDVTEVDGGAMIEINVVFEESDTSFEEFDTSAFSTTSGSGTVTKTITAAEQLPITLAATQTTAKKGKRVYLYGWVKGAEKNEKVRVLRAKKKSKVARYKKCSKKFKKGENKGTCKQFKNKFRTVKISNNQGYYRFPIKVTKKNYWWQTSATSEGERVKSEKVRVKKKK